MKNSKNIFKALIVFFVVLGSYIAFNSHSTAELMCGSPTMAIAFVGMRKRGSSDFDAVRQSAHQRLSSMGGSPRRSNSRSQERDPFSMAGGNYSDPWFNFGGQNSSFWDVVQNPASKYFQINFVNADPVNDYDIMLTGGILGVPGTTDKLITDGVIPGTGGFVSASASWNSIAQLSAFTKLNPTSYIGMKISSNNPLQISVTATYQPEEPWTPQLTSTIIPFQNYTDEDDFKSAFITLDFRPFNIELGNQSIFTIPIVANSASTMLLYEGPTVNSTHYLRAQFMKGVTTAQQYGAKMAKMGGKR